ANAGAMANASMSIIAARILVSLVRVTGHGPSMRLSVADGERNGLDWRIAAPVGVVWAAQRRSRQRSRSPAVAAIAHDVSRPGTGERAGGSESASGETP